MHSNLPPWWSFQNLEKTITPRLKTSALLECPSKLVSKMIAVHLQLDTIIANLMHPLQFGSLKHWSMVDAGFYLTEYITKAQNAGQFTSVLVFNVAQYFPSLSHEVLHILLSKMGFSPVLCCLFESYYEQWSTCYLWNTPKIMTQTMASIKVIHFPLFCQCCT